MRNLLFVTFLCASLVPGTGLAQPSPISRPIRPTVQPGNTSGAKPPAPGSTGDAGTAKDDPNFNECKNIPGYRKMKVTLKPESTLADLVSWISSITCKRFIVSAGLRAQRVTIYSPSEVTAYEAYKAFLSSLEAMNLTIQQSGQYYKVIEIAGANSVVQPLAVPGEAVANNESFTTAMIHVKHASVSEVAEILGKFKSKYGDITTYTPTNLLIITDMGTSITRLLKILSQLDIEGVHDERVWVLKVKNADAEEIATKLTEVFDVSESGSSGNNTTAPNMGGRRRGQTAPTKVYNPQSPGTSGGVQNVGTKNSISKIIAEPRTNSLIIVANDAAYLELLALFQKLDVPLPGGEEKINIVYLENAVAEDMASLLSALTGGTNSGTSRTTSTSRTSRTSRTNTNRNQRGGNQYGGYNPMGGWGGGGNAESLFQGPVQIQPDPATNSLVIVASNKDFLSIKRVIKELDRPRRQVFVEVTILEVSLDKTRNIGMSFHGGDPMGSGDKQSFLFGGSITNSSMNSIIMNPLSLMGMAVGLRGPEIKDAESLLGIPGISFPSFGVMFQALQSNNAVNVISSPHILTTDNEEAEITVGENVPFQSGYSSISSLASSFSSSSSALSSMPMVSVQRQDVALKLKLTPHVNQSDFVRMEVDQEINEVKSIDQVVGPTTSKRKATTVVVVKDQQTVVIGGLITEKIKENVQKVPLLGDIPILGYMFKSTTRITEKTNLLIFITPYIIRDESDLRRIFMEKVKLRKEFIEKYSSFRDQDFEADINYKHKHGFFEDINRTAHRMEEEIIQRKKAMDEYKVVDSSGPVSVNKRDIKEVHRMLQKMREDDESDPVEEEPKPADGKTPPADGKTPPADGKTPPADGKTPPADGKTPPADGKTPKPAGR
ncbi:type II secretion system secretin GspD [Myxococcota bacterium]|nr:type II secretion system secretin GspD [Myxococcota bacterium]MBU1410348.1 type II secretion system secretin GspD [Myxococcota bacterium]MBU1512019.1 type II secretion system secretin GspD [Myxococcota bacterium]